MRKNLISLKNSKIWPWHRGQTVQERGKQLNVNQWHMSWLPHVKITLQYLSKWRRYSKLSNFEVKSNFQGHIPVVKVMCRRSINSYKLLQKFNSVYINCSQCINIGHWKCTKNCLMYFQWEFFRPILPCHDLDLSAMSTKL